MMFVPIILRGIGQVMFQNNIYSGALFLIGIFYNSWLLGLAALTGTIISTNAAKVLKYSKEDIKNGLYGFNGTLTGITVFCFFEVSLTSILALVLGAILSAVVMNLLKKFLPPFTIPFVLVSWFLIYLLKYFFNFSLLTSVAPTDNTLNIITATGVSFGQVMLQENLITGLFFILAILINSKLMAVYAVYAAVLGSLIGWLLLQNTSINAGLMGYNAILCAIALVGKKWIDFVWITIAIILSTLLNIGMGITGIITLTAPFVLVTWGILVLKNQYNSRKTIKENVI